MEEFIMPKISNIAIEADSVKEEKGNYFVARIFGKEAVFKKEKESLPKLVSPLLDSVFLPDDIENKKVFVGAGYGKYYLFKLESEKPISKSFDGFSADEFLQGKSSYLAVGINDEEYIMDTSGKIISDGFYYINPHGLLMGESDYYLAEKYIEDKSRYAIFHKDKGRITPWAVRILSFGLLTGKSQYYALYRKNVWHVYRLEIPKPLLRLSSILEEGFLNDPEQAIEGRDLNDQYIRISQEELEQNYMKEDELSR